MEARYGSGTRRSLQIFLASPSLMSLCRGTVCTASRTHEDGMIAAFPEQPATVLLQVPDERASFHALTLSSTDHRPCPGRLLGQLPIGIEDHGDGFLQIRARFIERGALRVGAGQLLNETDVPLGHLAEHGRELKVHGAMIRLRFLPLPFSCPVLTSKRGLGRLIAASR